MKRIVSFVVVVLLCSPLLSAQDSEKRNLVYLGTGTLSAPELISKIADIWVTTLTAGYSSSATKSKTPVMVLGYQFYDNSRFSFGASVSYEALSKDVYFGSRNAGKIEAVFLSPMAELRYEYVKNENFGMFLDLGVGVCFTTIDSKYDSKSETVNKTILSAQFNPIGLRFGNRILIHLGLGFGMKGLFTGSIGYRF